MRVSVVIPTHRRHDMLTRCLEGLCAQVTPPFEVIVVEDETVATIEPILERFRDRLPVRMKLSGGGKGNTRNVGIRSVEGDLILLLDDDVVPAPDLVARHVADHLERHPDPAAMVLGQVKRHPDITLNAFRAWLDVWGPQFGYAHMPAHVPISPDFLYTCNISFRPSLVEGMPLDETLTFYEDLELGYRLERARGMTLYYDPDAVGYHLAEEGFEDFSRKRWAAGRARKLFVEMCPEARKPIERIPGGVAVAALAWAVMAAALRPLGRRFEHAGPELGARLKPIFSVPVRAAFLAGHRLGPEPPRVRTASRASA